MEISLSPELERLIRAKVESGKYASPGDVVGEALRLLHARDLSRQERLAELKRRIAIGVDEAERGDTVDAEEFFDQLLRENAAESRTRRKAG